MALDKWFWIKLALCPFILLAEAFKIYFLGCFGMYAGERELMDSFCLEISPDFVAYIHAVNISGCSSNSSNKEYLP